MANTYTLIASNTLSSSAASVTFSSIPATYTDLVLKMSVRTDNAVISSFINLEFNNVGGTSYSRTLLRGSGSAASSNRNSLQSEISLQTAGSGASSTSNTFSNTEVYIPSYLVSQNKPLSATSGAENNATEAYVTTFAGLWTNTNAITQIKITANGENFVSGSSFFLYGIKNS